MATGSESTRSLYAVALRNTHALEMQALQIMERQVERIQNYPEMETILRRHELTDPVLWRIAEAVHEADLDDERFDAPEAAGLDVLLRGLSMTGTDEQTLAVSAALFDVLYEYRRRLLLGREPA